MKIAMRTFVLLLVSGLGMHPLETFAVSNYANAFSATGNTAAASSPAWNVSTANVLNSGVSTANTGISKTNFLSQYQLKSV